LLLHNDCDPGKTPFEAHFAPGEIFGGGLSARHAPHKRGATKSGDVELKGKIVQESWTLA